MKKMGNIIMNTIRKMNGNMHKKERRKKKEEKKSKNRIKRR